MLVYVKVNNTYYVANLQFQTPVYTDPSKRLITYYQWIPMILLAQAACFVAPFLVWNILHSRSGLTWTFLSLPVHNTFVSAFNRSSIKALRTTIYSF